ncbi:hypothetical protein [Parasitella parasitica]|uniref:Uncharacterized protein n=1 Tax=Parasitella parasitica TaxID=35722 RepID=A0A0B7NH31_9FUNG|nr:hypothetical protein [Parasitella parasitica]
MEKQYETLIREHISSDYESRTCRYLLVIFSKPDHELFSGNILTVAQRKPIARYVFQKKANSGDCKWPSSIDKNDEIKSLVERTLAIWSKLDVIGAKPLTVPNVYERLHHYLKWTHEIQQEMSEKQFIEENVPQQTITPGYVYRNLKAINGVTKVNLKTFNSLKEAVLVAINSNKPLHVSNKMKCLSSDDLGKIKTSIAATQMEIHDKTFKPLEVY